MTTTGRPPEQPIEIDLPTAIDLLSDYCDRGAVTLDNRFKQAVIMGKKALILLEHPTDPRLIYARGLLLSQQERKDNGNHGS